jgi:hypothetical protein
MRHSVPPRRENRLFQSICFGGAASPKCARICAQSLYLSPAQRTKWKVPDRPSTNHNFLLPRWLLNDIYPVRRRALLITGFSHRPAAQPSSRPINHAAPSYIGAAQRQDRDARPGIMLISRPRASPSLRSWPQWLGLSSAGPNESSAIE